MDIKISDLLATRPDLIAQFRELDDSLVATLKMGGETGGIRRKYNSLTEETMKQLGVRQRPTGADFAQASLLAAARSLKESLAAAQVESSSVETIEETPLALRVRIRP